MNRIRYNNDKYEVLITPNLNLYPDTEKMSGSWTDEHLVGFDIKYFDNKQDAYYCAVEQPELDWYKLVRSQKDFYNIIQYKVTDILDTHNFTYGIDSKIMTPEQAKNVFFERVLKNGNRFTLANSYNDIITVVIYNPWYENLNSMADILKRISDLRIKKISKSNKIITLVGENYLGYTYSIVLVPTLIKQTIDWKYNNNKDLRSFIQQLKQVYKLQDKIDRNRLI